MSPEAITEETIADRLRALGTRGVLVQMAQRGQIIEPLALDSEDAIRARLDARADGSGVGVQRSASDHRGIDP